MKVRIASLALIWMGSVALAIGCDDEETDPTTPTGSGGGAPELKPAGGQCTCDADCEGEGALCMLGMCAKRATNFCDNNDRQINCDPGFQCFNTDIFLETGVCWPEYDEATCEFVENRHGVCSPIRGGGCDANCGVSCVPDVVQPTAAGAACTDDWECAAGADPMCYMDDDAKLDRFIGGYCMSFGCVTDEECGLDSRCAPLATDGAGVCVNSCGMDLDCRAGYACRTFEDWDGYTCWGGCDDAATCPDGYTCSGGYCVDSTIACSADNPHGYCPPGRWCDEGVCSDEPFVCTASDADQYEPNETRQTATPAPEGDTHGLTLCPGDEDWFAITVPAATLVRVGIDFLHDRGDIDLVAYDADGEFLGSRLPKQWASYPYSGADTRDYEWNTEYYGFYSESGSATYYVRVVGFENAENQYALHVDSFPYVDGPDCEAAGYTTDECRGHGADGAGLLPFPFPDPNDSVVGAGYFWEQFSSARYARREFIMGLRHALSETFTAFPGTTPLGIGDMSQIDGITPYNEVGEPHHPDGTHIQGGNVDMGYFQTDGDNDLTLICNDGSVHNDGYCSPDAVDTHIVDLKRQAYFMAKLSASPRLRTIGVDEYIGPLIQASADELADLPDTHPEHLTAAEASGLQMSYGSGWPFHHHHIHVSFQWWSGASMHAPTSAVDAPDVPLTMAHPAALRRGLKSTKRHDPSNFPVYGVK